VDEVTHSNVFSVMAETTQDVSQRDQLSVAVRYVGFPVERLLSIAEADNKSGSGLADSVLETLSDAGLDASNLAFQSYDFASAMSGNIVAFMLKFRPR